jgi:class 3 adenylate cyclase
MTEPAPGPAPGAAVRPEPLVRGFLFADLRGYTAFVERAGDAAAAELLERYRSLVRGVVAEQAGAEIRTEGDSFYVVFPSPSAAVRAGLLLVERARADAADHPDAPISVGVGIHAGESAETNEGYVGSAVNLAARICSVARAGEVLVSGTVRSLARTSLPVAYASRGKPTLKGVAEPIELFAVSPTEGSLVAPPPTGRLAAPASTRARAGLVGVGAAAVAIAVLGIAAIGGGLGGGGSSPSPSAGSSGGAAGSPGASQSHAASVSPTAGVADFRQGPLDAGTYRTTVFQPGLELTVPDGWMGLLEIPNAFVLGLRDDVVRATSPGDNYEFGGRLSILRPTVGASPCTPLNHPQDPRPSGSTTVEIAAGRDGFMEWARSNRGLVIGAPVAARLGAFDATGYEIKLAVDCGPGGVEILSLAESMFRTRYIIWAGDRTSWFVTEVDGQTILIAIDAPPELESFADGARSLLTSLELAD